MAQVSGMSGKNGSFSKLIQSDRSETRYLLCSIQAFHRFNLSGRVNGKRPWTCS